MAADKLTNQGKIIVSQKSGHVAIETAPDVCMVEGLPVPFHNSVGSDKLQGGTMCTFIGDAPVWTNAGQLGPPSLPVHGGIGKSSHTNGQEARATSYSRDAVFEGGRVVRSFDTTTQNHGNTFGVVIPEALPAHAGRLTIGEAIDVICTSLARFQYRFAKVKADAQAKHADAEYAKLVGVLDGDQAERSREEAQQRLGAARTELEAAKKSKDKPRIAAAQKEVDAAKAAVSSAREQAAAANHAIAAAQKQMDEADALIATVDHRLEVASELAPEDLLAIGILESNQLDPHAYFGEYDSPPRSRPDDLGAYTGAYGLFGVRKSTALDGARVLRRIEYEAPSDPDAQRGIDAYGFTRDENGNDVFTDPHGLAGARDDPQVNADLATLTLLDKMWNTGSLEKALPGYGTGVAYRDTILGAAQQIRERARESGAGATSGAHGHPAMGSMSKSPCSCAELRAWAASLTDEEEVRVKRELYDWIMKPPSKRPG
jgi:hypothetical protein